ncbi:MAG TPA: cytochrome c oxidase assembly protein [Humisphaera sp.]|jgi:putative membrane protein|nr:cytochrome c oxidase assembly protein [Humisphaera sp.]
MNARQMKNLLRIGAVVAILGTPRVLLAHEIGPDQKGPEDWDQLWRMWGFEPGTVIGLAVSAVLYALGLWRTWKSSGVGHGIRKWEAACFAGGWITLFVALVSPLHPLGQVLFSAHMTQHELLMLVAAPLLVLGRPMIAFLRALPPSLAGGLGRFSNSRGWMLTWGFIGTPLVAWLLHAIVLWSWHAPVLFQATLHNEWVHASQHVSFIATSLLFWWALIHGHRGVKNYGISVMYLFTTALHSGLLGALLTFARTVWYPDYDDTLAWGLTPLEDQQIGGLIMWVPACTVYIGAGLVIFARWLAQSEQRVVRDEIRSGLRANGSDTVPVKRALTRPASLLEEGSAR